MTLTEQQQKRLHELLDQVLEVVALDAKVTLIIRPGPGHESAAAIMGTDVEPFVVELQAVMWRHMEIDRLDHALQRRRTARGKRRQ